MDELKDLTKAIETLDTILDGLGQVTRIETVVNGWDVSFALRNYAGQIEFSAVKAVGDADV